MNAGYAPVILTRASENISVSGRTVVMLELTFNAPHFVMDCTKIRHKSRGQKDDTETIRTIIP